jgi:ferredoxin
MLPVPAFVMSCKDNLSAGFKCGDRIRIVPDRDNLLKLLPCGACSDTCPTGAILTTPAERATLGQIPGYKLLAPIVRWLRYHGRCKNDKIVDTQPVLIAGQQRTSRQRTIRL